MVFGTRLVVPLSPWCLGESPPLDGTALDTSPTSERFDSGGRGWALEGFSLPLDGLKRCDWCLGGMVRLDALDALDQASRRPYNDSEVASC